MDASEHDIGATWTPDTQRLYPFLGTSTPPEPANMCAKLFLTLFFISPAILNL